MCHIAELVIGGCVLIAMTTLGVVAILGVLGVLERTFGVLGGIMWYAEGEKGVKQAPEGEERM